ncbi:hypothetical protein Tco_1439462 [Tanacetum coccineum]
MLEHVELLMQDREELLQQRKWKICFDEYERFLVPLEKSPVITTLRAFHQACALRQEGDMFTTADGEGHVARQCKEPYEKMDSQYFKSSFTM